MLSVNEVENLSRVSKVVPSKLHALKERILNDSSETCFGIKQTFQSYAEEIDQILNEFKTK